MANAKNNASVFTTVFTTGRGPKDGGRGELIRPHVAFAKRILWQTYQYDWLGNNIQTGDDAAGFYDRSLGTIGNGTANDGPYQLRSANNSGAGTAPDGIDRTGQLNATYDETGNLETLFVQRSGTATCLAGTTCSQAFRYQWDELGRLRRARRWDTAAGFPNVPAFDSGGHAADLKYVYAAGDQRVIKTATDGVGNEVHTLYIYPSLELRRAEYDTAGTPGDYVRDSSTEVAYLFANGVRLARLVHEPLDSAGDGQLLRVFFELGDHLGSTSVALDKGTSELVQRSTYQAYGGAESDYRPGKWGEFREDYRFTGKEEDVEVGLFYFGKRFYNPLLQRWVSADPLEVHVPGEADANLYAYVSGRVLYNIDPLGLDPVSKALLAFQFWKEQAPTITPTNVAVDAGKMVAQGVAETGILVAETVLLAAFGEPIASDVGNELQSSVDNAITYDNLGEQLGAAAVVAAEGTSMMAAPVSAGPGVAGAARTMRKLEDAGDVVADLRRLDGPGGTADARLATKLEEIHAGYDPCYNDCSEIAEKFYDSAGRGEIIRVRPRDKNGTITINEPRAGGDVEYTYHDEYTDGDQVYDPMMGDKPIGREEWEAAIREKHPDARIYSRDPYDPEDPNTQ